MEAFSVRILASDHPFYEGECFSLVIPTSNGMYGIRARHSNMIAAVVPGTLQYQTKPDSLQEAAVSEELVKVENGEVLILVDTAERPEEIDANRARRKADEAKEALLQKKSIQEYREAEATLARALTRLRVKKAITCKTKIFGKLKNIQAVLATWMFFYYQLYLSVPSGIQNIAIALSLTFWGNARNQGSAAL